MTGKIKISVISDIIIFLFFCNILGDALNLMLSNILLLLAMVFMIFRGFGSFFRSVGSAYGIWILAFSALIFASAFWALSQTEAMNMAKTFIKVALMGLFIYSETNTFDKLILRVNQFTVATVYMMLRVMISFFGGTDRLSAFSQGAGLYFNTVAQILAFTIVLNIGALFRRKNMKKIEFVLHIIYILPAYMMIIWSGSRKGILIPLSCFVIILLFGKINMKKRFKYVILGAAAIIIVLYFIQANGLLMGRLQNMFDALFLGTGEDISASEREFYRDTAWKLFLNRPFTGWGANGFMAYLERINYSHVAYCHNNWLEILSSFGIVGFVGYYWFYIYAMIRLFLARAKGNNAGTVLLSIILSMAIFEFGIVSYYFAIYQMLFCFAAIFIKISQKDRSET